MVAAADSEKRPTRKWGVPEDKNASRTAYLPLRIPHSEENAYFHRFRGVFQARANHYKRQRLWRANDLRLRLKHAAVDPFVRD